LEIIITAALIETRGAKRIDARVIAEQLRKQSSLDFERSPATRPGWEKIQSKRRAHRLLVVDQLTRLFAELTRPRSRTDNVHAHPRDVRDQMAGSMFRRIIAR